MYVGENIRQNPLTNPAISWCVLLHLDATEATHVSGNWSVLWQKSQRWQETKNVPIEDEYLTPGKGKGIVRTKELGE